MKVYQEQVDVYHLIYDVSQSVKVKKDVELNRESKDTVRLIYEGKIKGLLRASAIVWCSIRWL